MRSLVCALVILVGCSKGGGIQLDIVGAPDHVTYVRVYISTVPVPNVASLSVPSLDSNGELGSDMVTATGQVFTRESNNENDIYEYTPGEALDLKFESGDNPDLTEFPAVIVVGFDTNGPSGKPLGSAVLTGLPLQANAVTRYEVKLLPIGGTDPNAAARIFLWSPDLTTPLTSAACVGVTGAMPAFIVSGGDTDCDGYPDGDKMLGMYECNPYVYKDVESMASLTKGQCFQSGDPGDGSDGACRLGGGTCADGSGPSSTLDMCNTADNICMPSFDCNCPLGSDTPLDCLLSMAAQGGDDTYLGYTCMIGTTVDTTGAPCSISLQHPPTGGFGCLPPGGNSQTGIAIDGNGTFDDSVQIAGVSYALDVSKSCDIPRTPTGSSTMGPSRSGLLLRLDLDDPTHPSSLVVPIAVSFTGGSCDGSTCTVNAALVEPTLTTCASGWSTPIDSKLVGYSPTLNAKMTEIFFISSDTDGTPAVMTATRPSTSDAWSMPADAALGVTLAQAPVAVHLGGNDTVLYVVDQAGVIQQFMRANATTTSTWTEGMPIVIAAPPVINAFAPDATDQDAIVAATDGNLYELSDGMTLGSDTSASGLSTGQTPFLTDDDNNLWYADLVSTAGSNGPYGIYVSSRGMKGEPFSTGVELTELGASTVTEGPWVSSELTTMFFASNQVGQLPEPHIYSATR